MPTVDLSVSAEVIAALVRLNGHARAYGCGKRAIYAYKTLVATRLAVRGELAVRLVEWVGPCGRCQGTGIYTFWEGDTAPCRHCRRGTVTLRFVETTFPDGVVWHHPFETTSGWTIARAAGAAMWQNDRYRDSDGREVSFRPVTSAWTPRQPGDRLNPDDAAAALNTVEAWLLAEPFRSDEYSVVATAKRELRGYYIDIGRIGFKCWYCGCPEITMGLGRLGPPLSWSAPVCAAHHTMPLDQWPAKDDLPAWAITPPLEEWRDRHVRLGFQLAEFD